MAANWKPPKLPPGRSHHLFGPKRFRNIQPCRPPSMGNRRPLIPPPEDGVGPGVLSAKGKVIVPTGVKMAIPEGFAGFIWDRSGLAANSSLHCLAGVVDSGYRGEVKVVLVNLSKHDMYIMKGMRIAQMVIQKIEHPILEEVESLDETKRNDGGFGSTGLH